MTDEITRKVHVLPLGGLGEIGLNMMVVAFGRDAFIIDSGLMFPDESMPGIDIVIPDFEIFSRQNWNVHGVFLTHGHEDHIGALPYLLKKINVPVYATGLTMGLIENKLDEFDLLGSTTRHTITTDDSVEVGPFKVDFFAMCHSVADGVGLAITTPVGVILHSGDFKLDPTPVDGRLCDLKKIALYARGKVLGLFSDSTNAERKGSTLSESMIRPAFEDIFRGAHGRIIIATFSSNIHRVQQVLNLARDFGRKVILVGRSMGANVKIAADRGYLDIPEGIITDIKQMERLEDHEVTVLSTGSQGEPMSALSLIAYAKHKFLRIKKGDVVVLSSRFIPGNERAITHIINEFSRRGAHVMYDKVSNVHVSGHASEEELRYLIRLVNPAFFIPIHGEYRHLLRHAHIAIEEGMPPERVIVAQNGDMLEFSENHAEIAEQVEVGRIFVHGKGVGDIGHDVLRDRRTLSEVGIVVATIVVDKSTGKVIGGPDLRSKGVTWDEIEAQLLDGAKFALEEKLAELSPKSVEQWENCRDEIRLAVRRHINRLLGRKPIVEPVVMYV